MNVRFGPKVTGNLAMRRTWLSAVDNGLAGSILTRPLHVKNAPEELMEKLAPQGVPQLIMRLGDHLGKCGARMRRMPGG